MPVFKLSLWWCLGLTFYGLAEAIMIFWACSLLRSGLNIFISHFQTAASRSSRLTWRNRRLWTRSPSQRELRMQLAQTRTQSSSACLPHSRCFTTPGETPFVGGSCARKFLERPPLKKSQLSYEPETSKRTCSFSILALTRCRKKDELALRRLSRSLQF